MYVPNKLHRQSVHDDTVVSNRWTGLLDWTTGLTFGLKLYVSHDLHPIRCAELGHMFI